MMKKEIIINSVKLRNRYKRYYIKSLELISIFLNLMTNYLIKHSSQPKEEEEGNI